MKSKSAVSKKASAKAAIAEVMGNITNPLGILFFCDYGKLEEVAKGFREAYPNTPCIGTAGRCYCNKTIDDQGILVATIITDGASVHAGAIKHLDSSPMSDLNALRDSIKAVSPGTDNTVCIEFCTNNEERLVSTLDILLSKHKIKLAGGTAFGQPEGATSKVAVNGRLLENACAYILIKNATGKAGVYKENIYTRGDHEVHIATKVNRATKELVQLDGRAAADVYSQDTGVSRAQIVDNVLQQPLGRVLGDEVFICSMYDIGSNGSLVNYKQFSENDAVTVLELHDYREIIEETKRELKSTYRSISTMISFNCIYRYLLFEQEGFTGSYLGTMSEIGDFVGYIAGGEQYNHQHVNQTMVCAVFE